MSSGLVILAMRMGTLVRGAVEDTAERLSVAKVLAAIAGVPMPHPNCDCTTCQYRWKLIGRYAPGSSSKIMTGARRRAIPKVAP